MPTKADVSRPVPSKAQLINWARQQQTTIEEAKQHLQDLAHGNTSERELFNRLIEQATKASYKLGGIHADLAEGRHS